MLPYINRKLFSRADVAYHKILIFLNGHFTINKWWYSMWTVLQFQIIWMILDAANMLGRSFPCQGTSNIVLRYSRGCVIWNSAAQNLENNEILVVYPCRFWSIYYYADIKKTAASGNVQTIWNCKALNTLDLLLLIVKCECPFNKIKILLWATLDLEKSFRWKNTNSHLNSHETVPLTNSWSSLYRQKVMPV